MGFEIPRRALEELEQLSLYGPEPEEEEEPAPEPVPVVTGKYFGRGATATERAAGVDVELRDQGPLKPGKAAHEVLRVYGGGERLTSYEASFRARGHHHVRRRESTRLLDRGYLTKDGTLPNTAPGGRKHVDAYRITPEGLAELSRLERVPRG